MQAGTPFWQGCVVGRLAQGIVRHAADLPILTYKQRSTHCGNYAGKPTRWSCPRRCLSELPQYCWPPSFRDGLHHEAEDTRRRSKAWTCSQQLPSISRDLGHEGWKRTGITFIAL